MEAVCLNLLVVLGSLVPNVYLAVVSKRGLHIPFPGGSQCNRTAKLGSHRGQVQLIPWSKALEWGRALCGKLSLEKQVQVPQQLRECGSSLPFPEVSALCSSWGWTDSPCSVQFCRFTELLMHS